VLVDSLSTPVKESVVVVMNVPVEAVRLPIEMLRVTVEAVRALLKVVRVHYSSGHESANRG
jgi:hypothetical protein